jgi:glucokinase
MPTRRTIGVDIGGTKLLAGVVGSGLEVHHRTQRTVAGLDQATLVDVAVDAIEELRLAAGANPDAVGFGIPSLIDQRTGRAVLSVNLALSDFPFAAVMAERLGLPVFVDNDANVAALAEHRAGAARGASDAVLLTVGTGIGGGLVLRGEVYRGATGVGAELGHIVIEADGPPCQGNCPNHGCMEALASGTALTREAARIAGERPDSALGRARAAGHQLDGAVVTELAHDGDAAATEVLALIGSRLGVGITSLVNALNPDVVVLGGGVLAAGELILGPARAEVAARAMPPARDHVRIVAASFGAEAGMIGAAALAFEGISEPLRA